MKFCFDSIEEVQDFVKRLKGTRGGKASDEGNEAGATVNHTAPPPLLPPQGGAQTFQPGPAPGAQFNPPANGAAFPGGGLPAGVDPAVQALVTRISAKIDDAIIVKGQPVESVAAWFRQQCGAEAANATMDQIKTVYLPKAAMPTLENIAKLMNA